jgi:hypothetical protein
MQCGRASLLDVKGAPCSQDIRLKPTSKVNTRLIIKEEDNIQHIFTSLALKVTSQSIIIGKLSSYARKNHTKKALWKLDKLLERANRRGDYEQADRIKRISPVSWKHINFYGQYNFLNAAGNIDLSAIVDCLEGKEDVN